MPSHCHGRALALLFLSLVTATSSLPLQYHRKAIRSPFASLALKRARHAGGLACAAEGGATEQGAAPVLCALGPSSNVKKEAYTIGKAASDEMEKSTSAARLSPLQTFDPLGNTHKVNVSTLMSSTSLYEFSRVDGLSSLASTTSMSQMEIGCLGMRRVPKTIHLLAFMVPTFGIYLANPILSLVDTACVGQFCSREELAALGPGAALCDMVTYLANFLAVATTSLLASALAKNDKEGARRVVACAFTISTLIGLGMTAALTAFGRVMLGWFTGSGQAAADTLDLSMRYVLIRGLGSAPTLLCMVAQAACIGAKDADSPLRAVAILAGVNIFLDWLFVGPLKTGVGGAAIATTISQFAGAFYLYLAVDSTLGKIEDELDWDGNILPGKEEKKKKPEQKRKGLFVIPTMKEFVKFFQFAGPIFLISFGRGYCWNICTPAAAAAGTIALAAHQIVINIFFFFTIAGESVFQTAQAFMPEFQEEQLRTKAMGGELHEQATARVKKLAKKILSISAIIGVLQSVLSLIPTYVFPGIFAQDKLVVQEVKNQAFNLALAIFPHCITIAIEALLLNSKDLDFLGGAYIVKSVLWTVTLKHFADQHANLNVLWKGMMALQYIRALVWTLRLILSGKKLGIPIYSRKSRKQRVQMSKESPV